MSNDNSTVLHKNRKKWMDKSTVLACVSTQFYMQQHNLNSLYPNDIANNMIYIIFLVNLRSV